MAFKKRTVFILGAGASAEAGMPLGGQLEVDIADALNFRIDHDDMVSGDGDLYLMLQKRFRENANKYTTAGVELARAIPAFTSIDEAMHFCSGNPELVQLGKSEIVRQIIRREASSALKLDLITERHALENVREKWYPEFLSMALAGLRKDALKSALQNVTIVNFNYDRTLEQYLYWALQTTASVTAEEAARVIEKLDVIRP